MERPRSYKEDENSHDWSQEFMNRIKTNSQEGGHPYLNVSLFEQRLVAVRSRPTDVGSLILTFSSESLI